MGISYLKTAVDLPCLQWLRKGKSAFSQGKQQLIAGSKNQMTKDLKSKICQIQKTAGSRFLFPVPMS